MSLEGEGSTEGATGEGEGTSLLGGAAGETGTTEGGQAEGEGQTQETPEQIAEREAAALAAETPEAKAAREAKELADAGAPEAYADFEVPEGIELQPEITDDFRAVAKELNLPQAAAQKVIDLGAKLTKSVMDAQAKAFADARAEWVTASKADAEFGGDKLNQSLTYAAKFRDAYATPELKTLLNESGMGDHPEVVRLFARAGKAISEAAFVAPGSKAPERIPGQIAYTHPTSKPKS